MKKTTAKSKSLPKSRSLFSPLQKTKKEAASAKSLQKSRSLRSPVERMTKTSASPTKPLSKSRSRASKSSKKPHGLDFASKKTLDFSPKLEPHTSAPSSVSDLRDLATCQIDRLKKFLNVSHSGILKEIDASKERISKKFKTQTEACKQLTEEPDKDFKKIYDRITKKAALMKTSYVKIISELQATSHVSKGTIPELGQSLEKRIEDLRRRYKIEATPV